VQHTVPLLVAVPSQTELWAALLPGMHMAELGLHSRLPTLHSDQIPFCLVTTMATPHTIITLHHAVTSLVRGEINIPAHYSIEQHSVGKQFS